MTRHGEDPKAPRGHFELGPVVRGVLWPFCETSGSVAPGRANKAGHAAATSFGLIEIQASISVMVLVGGGSAA